MSDSVEILLERAVVAWLKTIFGNDLEIIEGHTYDAADDQTGSRIVVTASDGGGTLVDEGIYEVPVEVLVLSDLNIPSEKDKHGSRVRLAFAALAAERFDEVKAFLNDFDPDLGVSGYDQRAAPAARENQSLGKAINYMFWAHLRES